MVSSLLSIGYLMPVVVKAFFFEPDPDDHHHGDDDHGHDDHGHHEPKGDGFWANLNEAPAFCVIPLCLTALGCIAIFFYAPSVYDLLVAITVEN